jgi:hypothetical protein
MLNVQLNIENCALNIPWKYEIRFTSDVSCFSHKLLAIRFFPSALSFCSQALAPRPPQAPSALPIHHSSSIFNIRPACGSRSAAGKGSDVGRALSQAGVYLILV